MSIKRLKNVTNLTATYEINGLALREDYLSNEPRTSITIRTAPTTMEDASG